MSTERHYHFDHLLQVLKKSLWSLILYIFFNVFMYIYSPRPGADNPLVTKFWHQQKAKITLTICCKFQNDLSELYTFFNYFICPMARADKPLGSKFWCQQKALTTSTICCKFQKNLWILILYTFLMFFHMYIALGQGQKTLCGQNSDVNRKALSFYPFVASFKKSLILYIFLPAFIHGSEFLF